MPAVSIVVAAYRAEDHLAGAVASVLAQTAADWELIVVADDGVDYRSCLPDDAAGDPRVRLTASGGIGTGPSAARNAGLAVARGAFVCALDADDRFAPDRLAALLPLAQARGLATDCVDVCDEAGTALRHAFPPRGGVRELDAGEIMGCGVPLHPLVHRDLAGEGWPPLRFAEDVVFNLQLLDRAGSFPMVMRPLYRYVVHGASICHGSDAAANADRGYAAILEGLDRDGFGLSALLRAEARAGFLEKRDVNRAFAEAEAKGLVSSFQEFMALRDSNLSGERTGFP